MIDSFSWPSNAEMPKENEIFVISRIEKSFCLPSTVKLETSDGAVSGVLY